MNTTVFGVVYDMISATDFPINTILRVHLIISCLLAVSSLALCGLRNRISQTRPKVFVDVLCVLLMCFVLNELLRDVWVWRSGLKSEGAVGVAEVCVGALFVGVVVAAAFRYASTNRGNEELVLAVAKGKEKLMLATAERERISEEASSSLFASSSKIKRLTSVVEASLHPIIGFNADGTVWQWGRAAEELLNLSADQVLGVRVDAHPGSALDILWHEIQRLESHPYCGNQSEVELPADSGQPRIVWMSLSRLPNHGEGLGGWSVNLTDITEKKRLEQKVSECMREKEALVKEVHHRVNNNFQLICSLLRLQSKEVTDLPSLSVFRKSEEQIRSLALVHEKFYRSESLLDIPFGDYLGELSAQLVRAASVESGVVRLESEIDDITFPIDVAISAGLIANELLSYSLKHVRSEGTESDVVKVSLRRIDGSIRLTISDNSRNAEAFEMVSEPTTLSFKLAKSLSVQLKGHLSWESDNGARFILSIPERIIDPASVLEKRAAA